MKQFFVVLGIIFACLVILGIIFIAFSARAGSRLDAESKAYVEGVVPLIVSSWDSRELLNQASPELLKVAPAEKIDAMFNMFSQKLGVFTGYKGAKGNAIISLTPQGRVITAAYIVQVSFARSDAAIRVRVIKHKENWQVLEFYVDSQAFMQ